MRLVADIKAAQPVKLMCGIIALNEEQLGRAKKKLRESFGDIDLESEVVPFAFTDYYEKEMGKGLLRQFVSFAALIDPGSIAGIKLTTNGVEKTIAKDYVGASNRPVNLDPGYVAASKLVLASTKDFSHRIYLGRGIYAEVTLIFRRGHFEPLEWTYPDYRTEGHRRFFEKIRSTYREQVKRT
jgi:hypothetical protein